MKKLFIFSPIVLIPLIIGAGLKNDANSAVSYAGEVILWVIFPLTAIAFVAVGLALLMTGKLDSGSKKSHKFATGDEKSEEGGMTAAEVSDRIDEINSLPGQESQIKHAQFIADQSAHAYRNSSKKGKIWGWIFYAFLMLSFATIPCFLFFKVYIGAIVSGALFVGTIIIAVLVKTLGWKFSLAAVGREPSSWVKARGIVVKCTMYSVSSFGGDDRLSAVRVTNVIFNVTVAVGGKEYEGYSSQFYDTGKEIEVYIPAKGKSKCMHIV